MKHTKLLLPVSLIATTCAVVTPALVSCKNDNTKKITVDLLTYKPDAELQHAPQDHLSLKEASDSLFGSKNSIKIIEQDIFAWLSEQAKNKTAIEALLWYFDMQWVGEASKMDCSLSNIKLEYDQSTLEARLSGKIEFKLICDLVTTSTSTTIGEYDFNGSFTLHNMPYKALWTQSDTWGVNEPTPGSTLIGDKTWSIDREYTGYANYSDPEIPDEKASSYVNYTYHNMSDTIKAIVIKMLYWSESYYLSKCGKPQ